MNGHRPSPPTISEVARAAGVGRATAARTLGGYGYVSTELRERVLAAAAELGYRANGLARSVSTGISHTIGIVVGDISNPFFGGLVRGIVDTARARGVDAFVLSTYERLEEEVAALHALVDKRVDGIILASAAVKSANTAHLELARAQGIPLVLADRRIPGLDLDCVVIDNRAASRNGTLELAAAGHRRIGFVWGPPLAAPPRDREALIAGTSEDISTDGERLLGYLDALEAASLPCDPQLIMVGEKTERRAVEAVDRMLNLADPPTAFFCTETDATTGALRALRRRELRLPGDVSLIGMDDSSWATVMDPPLTMLEQPMQKLGELSARVLLDRLTGGGAPPKTHRLDARYIPRASVGPPNPG